MSGGGSIVGGGGRQGNIADVTDGELHVRNTGGLIAANVTVVAPLPLPVDVAAQTVGNIAIDLAAASIGTLPVSIAGVVDVDVVAQAVGNFNIDIAEQSLPVVNVNVASPDPLPVDITSSIALEVSVTESRVPFSESTNGESVDIGQGVGNEVEIHQVNLNSTDQITLFLSNVDGPSTLVDVHIATVGNPIEVFVPEGETVLALDGIPVSSDGSIISTIEANTQDATSTVRAFGYARL